MKKNEDRLVKVKFNKPVFISKFEDPLNLERLMEKYNGNRINATFALQNIMKGTTSDKSEGQMYEPGSIVEMPYSKAKKYLDTQVKCHYIEKISADPTDAADPRIKFSMPFAELISDGESDANLAL